MKEELISFETAKLAKEKEFHVRVIYYYNDSTKHIDRIAPGAHSHLHVSNKRDGYYSAPTQSLLQRWLREVHGIHVSVFSNEICWSYTLDNTPRDGSIIFDLRNSIGGKMCKTYEQALEAGLLEALKLIEV